MGTHFMQPPLKSRNLPALVTVIALHAVGYVLAGLELAFKELLAGASEHLELALALPLAVMIGLLNAQVGPIWKARLVFLRWRHPLPGSFAFSRLMHHDVRIDVDRLTQREGPFPEDPTGQNRVWYRLFQSVKGEPEVSQAHVSYLLYRDWTGLLVLLMPAFVALAGLQKGGETAGAWAAIGAIEYLMVSRAARVHGERFVTTVLALVSAR
jgi:hypothetical protein